ncbi:MAG TPA: hypothetical protein DEA75_15585 [Rhodobacteraceae bacterium]|nr:hypothetical protein [Paracoccaceae bacterium]
MGYTSLTVAPPKVGKSMLALAEAIDIATGQGILTSYTREPLRVLYYRRARRQGLSAANALSNRPG